MKLKTLAALLTAAWILGASCGNIQVTVSDPLSSFAQLEDALGGVSGKIKEFAESIHFEIEAGSGSTGITGVQEASAGAYGKGIYRIRRSWNDSAGQLGAYSVFENAAENCPKGYYVFDESGRVVYDPYTGR